MIETNNSEGVLELTLAHGKVNAIDVELLEAICAAIEIDTDVRAIVLTGSGRAFSAGVDLKRILDGGIDYVDRFLPLLDETFRKLYSLQVPVVAAVNGHAIAGGCILVEACAYRVMAKGGGRIGVPELLVGVPFPISAMEILRQRLNPEAFEALILTGQLLGAEEALATGLIDEIADADQVLPRAHELATLFASQPPATVAASLGIMREPALTRMDAGADYNRRALERWRAADTMDTIRNYLERTLGR